MIVAEREVLMEDDMTDGLIDCFRAAAVFQRDSRGENDK